MRLQVLSDLHLEFSKLRYRSGTPDADVVILAGDTHPGVLGVMWAQQTFSGPVIMIPGNHEFYGKRRLRRHIDKMKAKADGSNVRLLYNEAIVIDGVRFLCSTLWTDYALHGNAPLSMIHAQGSLNDYEDILWDVGRPLLPENLLEEHQQARAFLDAALAEPFDGPTVVVTHHAPSERSVSEWHRNDPLAPCYASRLDNLVAYSGAALWIHGHIHRAQDYMLGDTRVIANPRGYDNTVERGHEGHYNHGFDPNLIVEV